MVKGERIMKIKVDRKDVRIILGALWLFNREAQRQENAKELKESFDLAESIEKQFLDKYYPSSD